MSDKSLLLVNTPEACEKCDCCANTLGKYICPPRDLYIRKGERDCSCPLVAVPEKLDPAKEQKDLNFIEGWNACLSAILGESHE